METTPMNGPDRVIHKVMNWSKIALMTIVVFLAISEAWYLTEVELDSFKPGITPSKTTMAMLIMRNAVIMITGTLCTFLFVEEGAKAMQVDSKGGRKVTTSEAIQLALYLGVALLALSAFLYLYSDALDILLSFNKDNVRMVAENIYKKKKVSITAVVNLLIDASIGYSVAKKVLDNNAAIKKGTLSATGSTSNTTSTTPPPNPSTATPPPPPFYNFIGKFKLNGGAAAITKVFSMPSSDSDLFKKSKLDSGQLGKICSDPTVVVEVMFNDSVASMDDMKVKLEAYGIDFSYVPN